MIGYQKFPAAWLLFCILFTNMYIAQCDKLNTPCSFDLFQNSYKCFDGNIENFCANICNKQFTTSTLFVSTQSLPEFLYIDVEEILLQKVASRFTNSDMMADTNIGYNFCKIFTMFELPQYTGFLFDTDNSPNGCVARSVAGLIHNFKKPKIISRFSRLEKFIKNCYPQFAKIFDNLSYYIKKSNFKITTQN